MRTDRSHAHRAVVSGTFAARTGRQNWNRIPISTSRGSSALVDRPKFGEVITPEGALKFTLLNAFVMLANTLRLVRVPPAASKKNAFEILKSNLRNFGASPVFRGTPAGRRLSMI